MRIERFFLLSALCFYGLREIERLRLDIGKVFIKPEVLDYFNTKLSSRVLSVCYYKLNSVEKLVKNVLRSYFKSSPKKPLGI